jgi:hypothetical protein
MANETAPRPTGWTPNPAGVERVLASLPHPIFAAAAPDLMAQADTKDVYLYKAWKDCLGNYPDYPPQEIGDCTSFGTGHGGDLREAVQIAIGKKAETYKELCTEAIYGMGRELANMLGGGDGCYGGAVAKAVSTIGTVSREDVGPYSGRRAKQWGAEGVPADIKEKAKPHKIKTVSLVTTWDEMAASLSNGYPVTVCSNQGFTYRRNDKGICEARGSWSHCMLICGIMWAGTSDESATIANSWGNEMFSGPTPNDLPPFAFNARRRVVGNMLAAQDSWALSDFDGFPGLPQPLPAHWRYGDLFS